MNDNQNLKTNKPRTRSMDMVGGKRTRTHRMSPEMEAAQARLKRQNGHSLPPRPRIRPEYGPMSPASRQGQFRTGGAPKRPLHAPQAQNSHVSHTSVRTGVSADRKSRFAELETVEFDNIESIASMNTSEELAASFVAEPKPLVPEPKENPDAVLRDFESLTVEDLKEGKGPDNNKFTLGGKSPFINTLNIEKRPLSGHSVAKKKSVSPAKAPEPRLTTSDTIPTVVASKRKNRKSNIALAIAIILTVIFGAIVGTFVYLAFFQ